MSEITISVRMHGHLGRYAGEKTGAFPVPVGAGETLAELVQRFRIPRAEISMIVVNGRTESRMDTPLHPGDEVSIFGLVGGG
jgi:molybdopterin converting factor small subunit